MNTSYIGFDGSDPSRSAFRWGLARAEADGSPVVLVHVVDDEWGLLGPDYAREAERRASSLLTQEITAAKTHPGLDIGALVLHGSPAWTLAAVPTSDDVLVVGTHKTGSLSGHVLGSRSVQIAAAAGCTVAAVPESTTDSRSGVVVGVDRFEGSTSAVIRGAQEARRLGHELILVHAPSTLRAEPGARDCRDPRRVRESPAGAPAAGRGSARCRQRSCHTVLGVSHPRPVTQSVIDSVIHDVLMKINVPVLIARSD